MIFPSIIGIPAFILQVVFGSGDKVTDVVNTVFSALIIIWSALYFEAWKRREVRYAVFWGQTDFQDDEVERVDFHGVLRRSPIDDRREYYFSTFRRSIRIFAAALVTLFMIGLVFLSIWGLLEFRIWLFNKYEGTSFQQYTITVVATINAIQIVIFNQIYNVLASVMTDFENHKTDSAFEQSLIMKTFLFQFVNSFNSIFYIAFIKKEWEG